MCRVVRASDPGRRDERRGRDFVGAHVVAVRAVVARLRARSRCSRSRCPASTWTPSIRTTWWSAMLNPNGESVTPWLLPGNYLFDRVPLLISFYHGSQQVWLGAAVLLAVRHVGRPACALTHAMFALFVLVALYALLDALRRQAVAGGARVRRPRDRPRRSRTRSARRATSRSRRRRGCSSRCIRCARGAQDARVRAWLARERRCSTGSRWSATSSTRSSCRRCCSRRRWRRPTSAPRGAWLTRPRGLAVGGIGLPAGLRAADPASSAASRDAWAYFQQTQKRAQRVQRAAGFRRAHRARRRDDADRCSATGTTTR